jgi:hypothetical protein
MPNSEIITCLEQKEVLLKRVMDLTKQIEVRTRQPDIDLEDFLEQRVPYMKRVQKCDQLIASNIKQMEPKQQTRMKQILNYEIPESQCSEEELGILKLAKSCDKLLQRINTLNKSSYDAMKRQYDFVREKLAELRKQGKTPNMFHR